MTGDIFGSMRCECGDQLEYAMNKIEGGKAGKVAKGAGGVMIPDSDDDEADELEPRA